MTRLPIPTTRTKLVTMPGEGVVKVRAGVWVRVWVGVWVGIGFGLG